MEGNVRDPIYRAGDASHRGIVSRQSETGISARSRMSKYKEGPLDVALLSKILCLGFADTEHLGPA